MIEQELFQRLKKNAIEDHEYLSNANKPARERDCTADFLNRINIRFDAVELESQPQESKVDVSFRDAKFQIKEMVDSGSRPKLYYKNQRKSFESSNDFGGIKWIHSLHDVPTPSSMYDQILLKLNEYSDDKRYKDGEKSGLDLMLIVSLTRASLVQKHELSRQLTNGFGWRSVSFVNFMQAGVLSATSSAPLFLQSLVGNIMWNPKYADREIE